MTSPGGVQQHPTRAEPSRSVRGTAQQHPTRAQPSDIRPGWSVGRHPGRPTEVGGPDAGEVSADVRAGLSIKPTSGRGRGSVRRTQTSPGPACGASARGARGTQAPGRRLARPGTPGRGPGQRLLTPPSRVAEWANTPVGKGGSPCRRPGEARPTALSPTEPSQRPNRHPWGTERESPPTPQRRSPRPGSGAKPCQASGASHLRGLRGRSPCRVRGPGRSLPAVRGQAPARRPRRSPARCPGTSPCRGRRGRSPRRGPGRSPVDGGPHPTESGGWVGRKRPEGTPSPHPPPHPPTLSRTSSSTRVPRSGPKSS